MGVLIGSIGAGRAEGVVVMLCEGLIWQETGNRLVEDSEGMSMIVPVGEDLMRRLGGDVGRVV